MFLRERNSMNFYIKEGAIDSKINSSFFIKKKQNTFDGVFLDNIIPYLIKFFIINRSNF